MLGLTSETVDALILDLLEWVASSPRSYAELLDVWRTSCPRLTVWEDATDAGLLERRYQAGRGELVCVSAAGLEHLRTSRAANG